MRSNNATRTLSLLILFLFSAATLPATADHPQEVDDRTVVFDHITGNEWWVEVTVDFDGDHPDAVSARGSSDGTWHALELKDWGTWGGSFHITPGDLVRFRAESGGTEALSCWFTHPDGVERCDAEDDAFDASFDTPGGNEWWVEVYVSANKPLAGVDARADGGAWQALELKDWGAWAKSFHVPDGSIVEFRAHATTGESDMSGGFLWPSGDSVETFDAAFGPKASNEWWVETYAIAEEEVVAVDARADGGAWHALELKDWGAWAASFHVPDGSLVEFRGTGEGGQSDSSDGFVWPSADPAAGDAGSWPHEGAYAHYRHSWGVANDAHGDVDAIFVHHDRSWRVTCTGTGFQGQEPYFKHDAFAPPMGPTEVAIGGEANVGAMDECRPRAYTLTVEETHEHEVRRDGDPVTVETWFGEWVPDCKCDYNQADWEMETGITVYFRDGMTDWAGGDLLDTNAPIGG